MSRILVWVDALFVAVFVELGGLLARTRHNSAFWAAAESGGGILGVDFSKLVSDCRVLGSRHEHGKGRDIPAVLQEVTLSRPIQPDVKTFCSEGYPKGPFCFVFVRSFSTDLRKYWKQGLYEVRMQGKWGESNALSRYLVYKTSPFLGK
jgi:hypothetical protein